VTKSELISAASQARLQAYAPYSRFTVGAALLGGSGWIYPGANVENISLGLTICAERVCVGAALQGGDRNFEALAIVTDSTKPSVPCGACRQVLAEFAPELEIVTATLRGEESRLNLRDLLPSPKQGFSEAFHVEHV